MLDHGVSGSGKEFQMRKSLFCMMFVLLAPFSQAFASDVGFSIGINVGVPGAPAPVYAPQPAVIEEPPEFIAPPQLGFYVAAGVPYDLFFAGNLYYFCRGNVWYTSPYFNGPWAPVHYNYVPYALRRYPVERIHYYRDAYFRGYREYGDWRGYRHFRPARHEIVTGGHGPAGPAYNTPGRNDHNTWSRPAYSGPNKQDQGHWNRPAYNTPDTYDRGSWGRPAHYGTSSPDQRTWNGPANNHANGNDHNVWSRPVYSSPNRQDPGNWTRPADNAQNKTEHGSSGRPDNNNANRSGQEVRNRPAHNGPNTPDRGNGVAAVNYSQNGNEQGNWGRQGHDK
jgi:hypothetical protein